MGDQPNDSEVEAATNLAAKAHEDPEPATVVTGETGETDETRNDIAFEETIKTKPSTSLGLIVFLRCPKPGQVKTRLARTVGDDIACEIYRVCAEGVLDGVARFVSRLDAKLYVFFSVANEAEDVERWVRQVVGGAGVELSFLPQKQTACLGARMVDAFAYVEGQGHDHIGILGTDVPDLADASVLTKGLRVLDGQRRCNVNGREGYVDGYYHGHHHKPKRKSAVLGPSEDGGFYMLLMRDTGGSDEGFFETHGDIFRGITWSTASVLEETCEALTSAGFEVIVDGVPRLRDLDEWQDCVAWEREQAAVVGDPDDEDSRQGQKDRDGPPQQKLLDRIRGIHVRSHTSKA